MHLEDPPKVEAGGFCGDLVFMLQLLPMQALFIIGTTTSATSSTSQIKSMIDVIEFAVSKLFSILHPPKPRKYRVDQPLMYL